MTLRDLMMALIDREIVHCPAGKHIAKWRSGFSQVNDKISHSHELKLRRSTIEGLVAPMTNLVKMLDALDTAVTVEEILAIESKLMKLYHPYFSKFDRIVSAQTADLRSAV